VGNKQGILYARSRRGVGETQIVARDLETGREEVLANGRTPVYSVTGHVLYQSLEGPTLWAVPFSLETLRKTGDPFVIRENASLPSVSRDGTLVYKDHSGTTGVHLAWFNRGGTNLSLIGQPQQIIIYAAIAPNENRIAVAGGQAGKANISIHDVNRPVKTLFSSSGMNPIWARSGKEILFSSGRRNGNSDIYQKQIEGRQEEKLLFSTEASEFASDWSADGKYVFYDLEDPAPPADIWYLTLRNDGDIEAKPFLATPFEEKAAKISPDGLWVVYVANESGAYEIYVRRFPEGGGKERVSVHGGTGPRWRRDGRKLYYVERDTLMEVDVESGPNLSISEPKALFATPGLSVSGSAYPHYDVSADGQRFVVPVPVGNVSIRVVQNWFAEFRDTAK
jgi:Tol biopolymer transport system component